MRSLIYLFFICISWSSYSQKVNIQEIESKLNSKPKPDSNYVNLLNQAGDYYYDQQNHTKALEYYKQALQNSQKLNFKNGIVRSHSNMASAYRFMGEYNSSIENHKKAIDISLARNDETQLAKSYINLGNVYRNTADFTEAISCYLKALEYSNKIKNVRYQSACLNNLGEIYRQQNNLDEALKYYNQALEINTKINDERQIATNLNNIGIIHYRKKEYSKALEVIDKSEVISEKNSNKRLLQLNYINKGSIYFDIKNTPLAKTYFEKALVLIKEAKDLYNEAIVKQNLSRIASAEKDYILAEKLLKEGLALAEKTGSKVIIAESYYDYMLLATYAGKPADSVSYYASQYTKIKNEIYNQQNAEEMAKLQNRFEYKQKIQENDLLKKDNRLKELEAVEMRLLSSRQAQENEILQREAEVSDLKIKEQEAEKKIQIQQIEAEKENAKKEKALRQLEQQKREIEQRQREKERETQTIINILLITIIGLAVMGLGYMFYSLSKIRKQKQALEKQAVEIREQANEIFEQSNQIAAQNEELRQNAEEILAQRDLLHEQNKLLEHERKNTLDSIRYAKNIQHALLPFPQRLNEYFSHFFALYQPKDIVSGDFYYFIEKEGKAFLALADCTGHGVPGAFMSSLGIATLENIIITKNIETPSEILQELDRTIQEALHQQDTGNQDGMDIAICIIDKNNRTIQFSGAHNGAYLLIDNVFRELEANKHGIGGYDIKRNKTFDNQTMQFQDSCQIFLFSDGFQDQFGGDKNKKYSKRRFKELIEYTSQIPLEEQEKHLIKELNLWKGEYEQIDDISVIGVKI
ncbi:MAG: tetratricopeptide repeat protein [Raineya sp.]|jgi:tetratricopeptide (TPR) repeat protein/serine phosphatase RsbU (regulator of sigma subunit)|nr:tetratricopeptide repeat protein [Raineya sp.]